MAEAAPSTQASAWEKQRRMDAIRGDPLFTEALLRLVEPEIRRLRAERAAELKAQQERDAMEQKRARMAWLRERIRAVKAEIGPSPEKLAELAALESELESLK